MPDIWRDLEDAAAELNPSKTPPKARLGYILNGVKVIDVDGDPSRVYVHNVGGGHYTRVLHKGRIRTTPVEEMWGTSVLIGKDELGYACILSIDSTQAPGILANRGDDIQTRQHEHSLDDIHEVGTFTPAAGAVLFGNGEEFNATQLEAALDTVVTGEPTGLLRRTGAGTYVIVDESIVEFNPDTILTDDAGNILVDDDGNVLIGD